MDSRLRFRPRFFDDEPPGDPGTKLPRSCGSTVSSRRQWQHCREEGRDLRGNPTVKGSGVGGQEKPGGESRERPYRKPTQVGEASSLR